MNPSRHGPSRHRLSTTSRPLPETSNSIVHAKEIMQRSVITVQHGTSLADAAQLMVDHGVNALPVLDEDGHVAGVIGIRDILRAPLPHASPMPILRYDSLDQKASSLPLTPVEKVMRRTVVSVSEEANVIEVAAIMANRGVHPVLVVNNGELVGVIGRADIVRVMLQRAEKHP